MYSLKGMRFQKVDKFGNWVFIASCLKEEERANYDALVGYHAKLVDFEYGTFLPIYTSSEFKYSTIRFKPDYRYSPRPRCTYDITFKITKIERDASNYVNCYVTTLKLKDESKVIDLGEEIVL